MMNSPLPVICLMGPTAAGKTNLAMELVQTFPVEIVSVDSAMVYRNMDIGTAKPTPDELIKAPHHLINLRDPSEPYSAGHFRLDVQKTIVSITQSGKLPLLVGGTMMYFHILQNGISTLPSANQDIRNQLSKEAKKIGWPEMYKKLEVIDPKMAQQLHPNDSQRIQRALEVFEISGQTMTSLQKLNKEEEQTYRFINITLEAKDRANLHKRIAQRFSLMVASGFLEEVVQLRARGDLSVELPSIRTVGYRQAWSYFEGEYDKETLKDRVIIATRQLAKRQTTWLQRWKNVSRFYFEDSDYRYRIIRHLTKELSSNISSTFVTSAKNSFQDKG